MEETLKSNSSWADFQTTGVKTDAQLLAWKNYLHDTVIDLQKNSSFLHKNWEDYISKKDGFTDKDINHPFYDYMQKNAKNTTTYGIDANNAAKLIYRAWKDFTVKKPEKLKEYGHEKFGDMLRDGLRFGVWPYKDVIDAAKQWGTDGWSEHLARESEKLSKIPKTPKRTVTQSVDLNLSLPITTFKRLSADKIVEDMFKTPIKDTVKETFKNAKITGDIQKIPEVREGLAQEEKMKELLMAKALMDQPAREGKELVDNILSDLATPKRRDMRRARVVKRVEEAKNTLKPEDRGDKELISKQLALEMTSATEKHQGQVSKIVEGFEKLASPKKGTVDELKNVMPKEISPKKIIFSNKNRDQIQPTVVEQIERKVHEIAKDVTEGYAKIEKAMELEFTNEKVIPAVESLINTTAPELRQKTGSAIDWLFKAWKGFKGFFEKTNAPFNLENVVEDVLILNRGESEDFDAFEKRAKDFESTLSVPVISENTQNGIKYYTETQYKKSTGAVETPFVSKVGKGLRHGMEIANEAKGIVGSPLNHERYTKIYDKLLSTYEWIKSQSRTTKGKAAIILSILVALGAVTITSVGLGVGLDKKRKREEEETKNKK